MIKRRQQATEQGAAPDRLQPTLVPRFGFRRRVSLVVVWRRAALLKMRRFKYNQIMVLFALLFFLPFRWMKVFTGFTFTDAEDFTPLLTLLIGLIGVVLIRRSPQEKASSPLIALLLLLGLWPLLPNFGLFFMARELQSVNGSWPQVMVDDPKNLYGHISPGFDALFHLISYLEAFSGAWMVVFLALLFAVMSRLSSKQLRLCLGLMVISLFLVLVDPGNLYAWWLD